MRIVKQQLSSSELLELLNCQWCSASDIAKIGAVGVNRAGVIKKEIVQQVKENTGKECPPGLVPTQYVKDYFGININYLKKFQKKEMV